MPTTARKPRLNREQQKAQRATELLDAAWDLFCQKGYETLRIDEVAELAGYSRMPIYSLFGDKQNLFFELWRSKSGELAQQLLGDCPAGNRLDDNLKRVAAKIAASSDQPGPGHGEHLFSVVQTISLNRPDIREKLDLLARDHIAQFSNMISESALLPSQRLRDRPDIIARHIIAHINGTAMVTFQTRENFLTAGALAKIFCYMALQ